VMIFYKNISKRLQTLGKTRLKPFQFTVSEALSAHMSDREHLDLRSSENNKGAVENSA